MSPAGDLAKKVDAVLAELRALGSEEGRAGMARFGINTEKAFGVSMAAARPLARKYRRQHAVKELSDPKQIARIQLRKTARGASD
jgi:3-methyladenine DNA glycosylase AlkD